MRRGGELIVVVGKVDNEGFEQARIRGRRWGESRGHITDERESRNPEVIYNYHCQTSSISTACMYIELPQEHVVSH